MEGVFVIVSGYSGAGKTTIVKRGIVEGGGARIITCTTRSPREGEVPDKEYRFLTKREFTKKLKRGAFAEYAEVYGNFYGTLILDIHETRRKFPVAFLIVDVQGAKTLMRKYPEAWGVFISIPRNELKKRLIKRGDMNEENIARRMAKVDTETAKMDLFDKIVRNKMGELDASVQDFLSFIKKCRGEAKLPQRTALGMKKRPA